MGTRLLPWGPGNQARGIGRHPPGIMPDDCPHHCTISIKSSPAWLPKSDSHKRTRLHCCNMVSLLTAPSFLLRSSLHDISGRRNLARRPVLPRLWEMVFCIAGLSLQCNARCWEPKQTGQRKSSRNTQIVARFVLTLPFHSCAFAGELDTFSQGSEKVVHMAFLFIIQTCCYFRHLA